MIRVDYEDRDAGRRRASSATLPRRSAEQLRDADIVLDQRLRQGRLHAGAARAASIAAREGRGMRVDRRPDPRRRLLASITAARRSRRTASKRASRPAARIATHDEALAAAAELRDRLDLEAGIVTLDKDGMALAHRDGRRRSSRRGRGRSTTSPAPATW